MTTATVTTKGIDASAMLIDLRISQWTARKMDKKTSAKVTLDAGAAAGSGAYYKTLVSSDHLEAIKKKVNVVRAYHYQMTLPWSDAGPRILPADAYMEYAQTMQEHRIEFDALTREFLDEYPLARQEARRILGTLFDETDYPQVEAVALKFRMGYEVMPMPTAQDFRVNLAEDEVAMLRADIEQRTSAILAQSMRDVYERILKVTEAFVDRLGDEDKIFRNSLVENARTLRHLLPKFNLTGDPKLEELAAKMDKLCEYEPEQLRSSFGARTETHRAAVEIKKDLMDFFNGEFQ